MSEISPMMKEYLKTKEEYKDCILFYRLGDFYEMFFDDAKTASKELELTLTGKNCGLDERAPMCGVPFHSADTYISKLVRSGHKVAICEQLEDPKEAKGLVKRGVIRIVTPGTDISASSDSAVNNYIACIYYNNRSSIGLAFSDVGTGDFFTTETDSVSKVIDELSKYSPSEIIYNEALENEAGDLIRQQAALKRMCQSVDRSYFLYDNAIEALKRHFKVFSPAAIGLEGDDQAIVASGALISYLTDTQMNDLSQLTEIHPYSIGGFLIIDHSTLRNLELTETMRQKEKRGSLFWVLDHTKTAMGQRRLKSMLTHPLLKKEAIDERLDGVEELSSRMIDREEIRERLTGIYDINRLLTRVSYRTANPRDILSFRDSIRPLSSVKEILKEFNSKLLSKINDHIDPLGDILSLLDAAIDDDAPATLHDGGILKEGFNEEADKLRKARSDSKQWLLELETRERERTGIAKLRVRYNKVFGYFIEVSNSYKDKVPPDYIRKQTLVNAERFYTKELKELENTILGASDRLISLEKQIFSNILDQIDKASARIRRTADAISLLDVLSGVADVSQKRHYIRPSINQDGVIDIKGGRHPVVELMIADGSFIANDTYLDREDHRTAIITGPNMAGKSTYMRQTAVIVLMAQCGFFVPADSADIGICDRIFTRVGASDDLATGQSTFMVEMNEVANILKNATRDSLVILDEIGRGTSTFDGLSIAQAVVEYVTEKIGAATLFATHYHELTALEGKLAGTHNYCVAVKEDGDDVTFLRKIIPGEADRSYGIEVAKLAGVPSPVLRRARSIAARLERDSLTGQAKRKDDQIDGQLSFYDILTQENEEDEKERERKDQIINRIKELDPNSMTPIEALNVLDDLRKRVRD
ncbi:DNA mismatch repair protein MutS [Candidatus Weimeria sp. HCP3S3_B5]|uniref:DNA mismatch repair protein MutS n=1 Tax=Candidatus Weimeria sp. HCP3S3_B5 TaxID=3438871 RepID=UPI003F88DF7E